MRPKTSVHFNTVRRKEFSRLEVMSAVGFYGTCLDHSRKIEFIFVKILVNEKSQVFSSQLWVLLGDPGWGGSGFASVLLSH